MNIKRIIFWLSFVVVLGLVVWGLVVSGNKTPVSPGVGNVGTPAPVTATDHVFGPENAPVTLIEYSDFQCPACEVYYGLTKQLLADASTTVRLVYRHFPLPQHPNAIPATLASEAASLQGKFWEMADLIFTKHAEWTELADPQPVFDGYAKSIGLDVTKFKADMKSSALRAAVDAGVVEGRRLNLSYTPSFFMNGKLIENPQGYEAFKTLIQSAAR